MFLDINIAETCTTTMRQSYYPLTGSALVIGMRLWTTVKELSLLEVCVMVLSSVVFAYKKRKRFLPFLRNLWSNVGDIKSITPDDSNELVPNILVKPRNKRKQSQDTHKQAREDSPSYEPKSNLKKRNTGQNQNNATSSTRTVGKQGKDYFKRPGVMNNKNSQTVDQLAITSKQHKIESSRATNTGHVNEPVKNLQTSCSMCTRNIRISKPSDLPTMPACFHKFCKPCFEPYFTDIINQMDVTMWLCPLCGDSLITDYKTYFKEFTEVLKNFMGKDIVEIANERLDRWFRSQESTNTGFEVSVILYECEMCVKKVRESELIGMPRCQHRFCLTCTMKYFSMEIEERVLAECYCPFCLKDEDMASKEKVEYFTQLGRILKPLINSNTFRKFERKLEELSYTDMCIKCYSPVKPRTKSRTVECGYCSTQACRECRLLWDPAHDGKSCKDYEVWISTLPCHAYNMSRQPIVCGSCGETFLLIRDGTLLFSCPKCQKQMCRSCKSPFYLGAECPEGEDKCSLLFFHAHHPVNCLFYLQNKEVDVLYQFLKDRNLAPRRTSGESFSCKVEVKKIFRNQFIYDKCGQVLCNNYLGLCKNHAVDFLSTITVKNSVDTRVLFNDDDLRIYNQRNVKEMDQRQIDCGTRSSEESESQFQGPHSSSHQSDAYSTTPSSSEQTQCPMEIVTEGSSPNESNVLTQPDIKPHEVTTICNRNEEGSDPSPNNACSSCYQVSQNRMKNIFGCEHYFCTGCIQLNFLHFTKWQHQSFLSCPKCFRPDIYEDNKYGQAYLAALSISLEKILNSYHYELFTETLQNYLTSLKHSVQGSDIMNANLENGGINPGSSSGDIHDSDIDEGEMAIVD